MSKIPVMSGLEQGSVDERQPLPQPPCGLPSDLPTLSLGSFSSSSSPSSSSSFFRSIPHDRRDPSTYLSDSFSASTCRFSFTASAAYQSQPPTEAPAPSATTAPLSRRIRRNARRSAPHLAARLPRLLPFLWAGCRVVLAFGGGGCRDRGAAEACLGASPERCAASFCPTCSEAGLCDKSCGYCASPSGARRANSNEEIDCQPLPDVLPVCPDLSMHCSSVFCPSCPSAGLCDSTCGFCTERSETSTTGPTKTTSAPTEACGSKPDVIPGCPDLADESTCTTVFCSECSHAGMCDTSCRICQMSESLSSASSEQVTTLSSTSPEPTTTSAVAITSTIVGPAGGTTGAPAGEACETAPDLLDVCADLADLCDTLFCEDCSSRGRCDRTCKVCQTVAIQATSTSFSPTSAAAPAAPASTTGEAATQSATEAAAGAGAGAGLAAATATATATATITTTSTSHMDMTFIPINATLSTTARVALPAAAPTATSTTTAMVTSPTTPKATTTSDQRATSSRTSFTASLANAATSPLEGQGAPTPTSTSTSTSTSASLRSSATRFASTTSTSTTTSKTETGAPLLLSESEPSTGGDSEEKDSSPGLASAGLALVAACAVLLGLAGLLWVWQGTHQRSCWAHHGKEEDSPLREVVVVDMSSPDGKEDPDQVQFHDPVQEQVQNEVQGLQNLQDLQDLQDLPHLQDVQDLQGENRPRAVPGAQSEAQQRESPVLCEEEQEGATSSMLQGQDFQLVEHAVAGSEARCEVRTRSIDEQDTRSCGSCRDLEAGRLKMDKESDEVESSKRASQLVSTPTPACSDEQLQQLPSTEFLFEASRTDSQLSPFFREVVRLGECHSSDSSCESDDDGNDDSDSDSPSSSSLPRHPSTLSKALTKAPAVRHGAVCQPPCRPIPSKTESARTVVATKTMCTDSAMDSTVASAADSAVVAAKLSEVPTTSHGLEQRPTRRRRSHQKSKAVGTVTEQLTGPQTIKRRRRKTKSSDPQHPRVTPLVRQQPACTSPSHSHLEDVQVQSLEPSPLSPSAEPSHQRFHASTRPQPQQPWELATSPSWIGYSDPESELAQRPWQFNPARAFLPSLENSDLEQPLGFGQWEPYRAATSSQNMWKRRKAMLDQFAARAGGSAVPSFGSRLAAASPTLEEDVGLRRSNPSLHTASVFTFCDHGRASSSSSKSHNRTNNRHCNSNDNDNEASNRSRSSSNRSNRTRPDGLPTQPRGHESEACDEHREEHLQDEGLSEEDSFRGPSGVEEEVEKLRLEVGLLGSPNFVEAAEYSEAPSEARNLGTPGRTQLRVEGEVAAEAEHGPRDELEQWSLRHAHWRRSARRVTPNFALDGTTVVSRPTSQEKGAEATSPPPAMEAVAAHSQEDSPTQDQPYVDGASSFEDSSSKASSRNSKGSRHDVIIEGFLERYVSGDSSRSRATEAKISRPQPTGSDRAVPSRGLPTARVGPGDSTPSSCRSPSSSSASSSCSSSSSRRRTLQNQNSSHTQICNDGPNSRDTPLSHAVNHRGSRSSGEGGSFATVGLPKGRQLSRMPTGAGAAASYSRRSSHLTSSTRSSQSQAELAFLSLAQESSFTVVSAETRASPHQVSPVRRVVPRKLRLKLRQPANVADRAK